MAHSLRALARPEPSPRFDGRPLLTPTQVGQLAGGRSSAWVRRQKALPKIVLGHSTVRYFPRDVEQWLASR